MHKILIDAGLTEKLRKRRALEQMGRMSGAGPDRRSRRRPVLWGMACVCGLAVLLMVGLAVGRLIRSARDEETGSDYRSGRQVSPAPESLTSPTENPSVAVAPQAPEPAAVPSPETATLNVGNSATPESVPAEGAKPAPIRKNNVFNAFDRNGDGYMDLDEWQARWPNGDPERGARDFRAKDVDGDGRLSVEEFAPGTKKSR